MTIPTLNLPAILPEIILVVAALIVLLLDVGLRQRGSRVLAWLSLIAILLALAATVTVAGGDVVFQTTALNDGLGRFMGAAVLVAAALGCLISMDRVADFTRSTGAYFSLFLLAAAGMRVLTIASDFMTIFLGLEILSLALYILVGMNEHEPRSAEASLKYFLLGAFASSFFLYGIAAVYAATGTTNLTMIAQGAAAQSTPLPGAPFLPIGMGLLLVGFGFKLALVPFHMWTPDAYQGAPTPVTAFMSVATKTAAFAALIRVLAAITTRDQTSLVVLAVLAALTMTVGNLAALRQNSLKRMLAYSSIAHAGYVLTGLAAGTPLGAQAAMYYLLTYTFMNVGAFAVLYAVQRREENDVTEERITGLAARQPALAALMAVFMFSLTGIPPLAGFFGKLYVFGAAVNAGLIWLVIIGVLNSAISAYYYLRVTVVMYMSPTETIVSARGAPAVRWPAATAIGIAAVATVVLGIWQYPWIQTITQAVASLAIR